jgi:hypothetical protein
MTRVAESASRTGTLQDIAQPRVFTYYCCTATTLQEFVMAQTIHLHSARHRDAAHMAKVKQSVRLGAEKFGVIAGFLLGLFLGFGLLAPVLMSLDAPSWGIFVTGAVITAAMTRLGQICSLALSRAERYDAASEDI